MMASKTANEIAALFYERFKNTPKVESDRCDNYTDGFKSITYIQTSHWLSRKQVNWLRDVYEREQGYHCWPSYGGTGGRIPGLEHSLWKLYISPSGSGTLSVLTTEYYQ
jgi:hypothetical protein